MSRAILRSSRVAVLLLQGIRSQQTSAKSQIPGTADAESLVRTRYEAERWQALFDLIFSA
jgi:hypothetical protein